MSLWCVFFPFEQTRSQPVFNACVLGERPSEADT